MLTAIATWLLPRLFGLLDWLKVAARYLVAHPATLAAIVFAVLWRVEAHDAAKAWKVAEQHGHALQAAQDAAAQAKAIAEAKSKEASNYAEKLHTAMDTAGPRLVAGYAATRRVPTTCAATAPGPPDHGSAVPQDAPAVPAVAVPESVLNTCDADYSYALSAHEWAKQFEAVN